MCTYMIMDVELFMQVLVFLSQLAPQEQRRHVEISQLDSQLTKAEESSKEWQVPWSPFVRMRVYSF